ncbi:MAG: hypothetical protein HGB12_06965 [Bacteroidetes bacterium]|nr:hypothetical protein [Bacteroidota bacterium]
MAKKSKIKKLIEADEREKRKDDGYYDGRFRTKVVPDKKKKYKRKKKVKEDDKEAV